MTLASPQHRGRWAEDLALQWLSARGFELIERNFRWRGGEIDLLGYMQQELLFIEVRYRSHDSHGGAAASVTQSKQRRIRKTAMRWLQMHPEISAPCRFDVVAIAPGVGACDTTVEWLAAAFE